MKKSLALGLLFLSIGLPVVAKKKKLKDTVLMREFERQRAGVSDYIMLAKKAFEIGYKHDKQKFVKTLGSDENKRRAFVGSLVCQLMQSKGALDKGQHYSLDEARLRVLFGAEVEGKRWESEKEALLRHVRQAIEKSIQAEESPAAYPED